MTHRRRDPRSGAADESPTADHGSWGRRVMANCWFCGSDFQGWVTINSIQTAWKSNSIQFKTFNSIQNNSIQNPIFDPPFYQVEREDDPQTPNVLKIDVSIKLSRFRKRNQFVWIEFKDFELNYFELNWIELIQFISGSNSIQSRPKSNSIQFNPSLILRLWFHVVVPFDRKGLRRRDKNRWKALVETHSTVSLRVSERFSIEEKHTHTHI